VVVVGGTLRSGGLRVGLAGCVGLAGLALTGCGKAATPAVTMGYPASAAPVTIDFWYMPYGGPIQDQAVVKETEAFHAEHPNITVRPVRVEWSDALTRISTASTSGTGPDVTQLGTTWVGGFTELGGLRPYPAPEVAALGGQAAFTPAAWTSTHLMDRPEITAAPWLIDIQTLYYRTDLLRKAGRDPATAFSTWAAFETTLAKLKTVTGSPPLAVGTKNSFGMIHPADVTSAGQVTARAADPGRRWAGCAALSPATRRPQ
jgi:multiple sugar transport system substrate-binding protein